MHSGFDEFNSRPASIAFCCSINFSYNVMNEDVGIDEFETTLTGCCSEGDCGSFVDALCFPWCVVGWQASALKEDGSEGCCNEACVKTFIADLMCLNVLFLSGVGRCCVPWLGSQQAAYHLRRSVRQHYRLKEPDECCTNDCLIGCFCATCSLAQNTREIERVSGYHPGGCCSRPHPELQQKANERNKANMFYSKDPNVKMMEMMVQKQKEAGNDLTKTDDDLNNRGVAAAAAVSSSTKKAQEEPTAENADGEALYDGVAL